MNCGRLESVLTLAKNQSLMLKLLNVCHTRPISFLSSKSVLTNGLRSPILKTTPVSNQSIQTYFVSVKSNQQRKQEEQESAFSSLVQSSAKSSVSTHVTGAKRVKQAATDMSYFAIIGTGVLMLGAIGYYLFSALFSRETPEGIYNESSKICLENFDVQEAFGSPIKVTAESGGRRVFQIRHKFALENGRLTLVMNYYLEGPKNKGSVICKVFKNESTGKFEYEYIVVKLDYVHRGDRRIIVKSEDESSR